MTDGKKEQKIHVRLSDEELERIKAAAAKLGLNPSTFLRMAGLQVAAQHIGS